MSETLEWIAQRIQQRRPAFLITANLDFAEQASRDVELHRILIEADLVVCDGTPLLWASRLIGQPLRERVAGSDLVPKLAERSAREGWKIFLLGGEPQSLAMAEKNLISQYPGIIISGSYSPPFSPLHEMDHAEISRRIKNSAPDILLVAFGCPKQEKWISKHYKELGVPCSIGVGATIDFLAGKVRRAPDFIGRLGLEWVFRLCQEPRLLTRRYLNDMGFLISQLLREKNRLPLPASSLGSKSRESVPNSQPEIIVWEGSLIAGNLDDLSEPSFSKQFIIDLSSVTIVDSAGLGHILRILRRAWEQGLAACYVIPSSKILSVLQMTRLDRVIPFRPSVKMAIEFLQGEDVDFLPEAVLDESEHSLLMLMPQNLMKQNVPECLRRITKEWSKRPKLKVIQLDFSRTHSLDSAGLGLLVKCHRMVRNRPNARMHLVNIPPNVLNVIRAARLEQTLGILG